MFIKYIYIFLGLFFVAIGYIGIIIPGIPTTPFLLLSIWFFSRSSKRFESWLLNHKIFGQFISDWNRYRGIRKKSKIYAIVLILFSFSLSIFFAFSLLIDVLLLVVGIILCLFIATRPVPPDIIN